MLVSCKKSPTGPGGIIPGPPGTNWTTTTAPSGTTKWHGIAYGNGKWVVVGTGFRATSFSGQDWTSSAVPSTVNFQTAVSFNNGVFVAPSKTGVSTSLDGVAWTDQSLVTSTTFSSADAQSLVGIAYGNGTWVMADDRIITTDQLVVFVSTTNGASWEQRYTNIPYSYPRGIGFGDGVYVVVGHRGLVATSTDLISWTTQTLPDTTDSGLMSVTFANGIFVVATNTGKAYRSINGGVTWTKASLSIGSLCGVAFGNGLFVVTGAGIYTSPDAITWTQRNWPRPAAFEGVRFGNGRFVAIGPYSFAMSSQ